MSVIYQPRFFWVVLIFFTLILRSSALYTSILDIDESQFWGFAHTLYHGGLPYLDSLDTKPPLIYLFYLFCLKVFGEYNMIGVHLVGLLTQLGVAICLVHLARFSQLTKIGQNAALFYLIFSTCFLPKFIATSITSVMVLPLCLSVLCWFWSEQKKNLWGYFLAGIFSALAFLFKYQGGIQIVIFFSWLVYRLLKKEVTFKTLLSTYTAYFIGFILPIGLTIIWLDSLGVWGEFYRWSIEGSQHYINAGDEVPFLNNLLIKGGGFVLATIALWILAGKFLKEKIIHQHSLALFTLIWAIFSLVPVFVGGRFYAHYFIQVLPPLCLMATFAWQQITHFKKTLQALILIPTIGFWILRIDPYYLENYFPDDQLNTQQKIGRWIKAHSQPQNTLFVWGFATAIYFHAERQSVSRFLWTDLLTGKIPGDSLLRTQPLGDRNQYIRPEAWEAFWMDINKSPPDIFVDTASGNIHSYQDYPIEKYNDLHQYLASHYELWQSIEKNKIYRRIKD